MWFGGYSSNQCWKICSIKKTKAKKKTTKANQAVPRSDKDNWLFSHTQKTLYVFLSGPVAWLVINETNWSSRPFPAAQST